MTVKETACKELVQVNTVGRKVCSFDGVEMYSADVKVKSNLKDLGIWTEKGSDAVNISGLQEFGIEYYQKNDLLCKYYESEYNIFIVIGSKGREYDGAEIESWESIFWPTSYDVLCSELRRHAGTVAIEFFEDVIQIYVKDFIFVISKVEHLQRCILALAKFYDSDFDYSAFSEESRKSITWDPHDDYETVYECLPEYRKNTYTTKELAVEQFWRNML